MHFLYDAILDKGIDHSLAGLLAVSQRHLLPRNGQST
jgi:hypothetical protein